MLKTLKYIYSLPACARIAVVVALFFCAGGQELRAQGYYTLTNGHYYWFDGRESDPDDTKYLTGFDKSRSWAPIYTLGTHTMSSVTEIVAQGDTYLALNIDDPENPYIQSISTIGGFSPLCVWYRKGKTDLYYQEWDGYRYYLYAHHTDGSANDLSIYRVAAGAELEKQSIWYDWDHGAAITEVTRMPGVDDKESYYWLMYDDRDDESGARYGEEGYNETPVWRMSKVSCYQRPEEIIYTNYHADGAGGNTADHVSYYDSVRVSSLNFPAGVAATFMPVTKIEHPTAIVTGNGLSGMYVEETNDDLNHFTFEYGPTNITVNPVLQFGVMMLTTPEYTEYVEETYRRGINLNSAARESETFNSAGVPTVRRWYYYPEFVGGGYYGDIIRNDEPPEPTNTWADISNVRYTIDSRASRYVEILDGMGNTCQLSFKDRPLNNTVAHLTCWVFYSNGTFETLTDTINITVTNTPVTPHSLNGPVVKGSVFGGGRMANVQGNTSIIVHNADSLYAVYGGNDIAGWVQGEEGATVQIGSRFTNKFHPVHIGWVYGGGCGFYQYSGCFDAVYFATHKPALPEGLVDTLAWVEDPGHPERLEAINDTLENAWASNDTKQKGLGYGHYAFRGGVYDWNTAEEVVAPGTFNYAPYKGYRDFAIYENGNNSVDGYLSGTIPYIRTAHVMVGMPEVDGHNDDYGHNAHEHNDYILIDSLFGGAENAFIGVTSSGGDFMSAISVDINGGTIMDVFGGNNYGGSIANTAMTLVNINCTKLTDDESMVYNTYYGGMGRDQGIRHVYGGGNKVASPHAQVTFNGGMVDTAYIGGNMASVSNPVGIVNCQRDGTGYGPDGNSGSFQNGHFIYTNPTLTDTTSEGLRDATKNLNYVPDTGLYNVHFLFGGNNNADMENVAFVQLLSGGVGAVLGGGNKGDMKNDKTTTEAVAEHRGYIDITPLLTTLNGILGQSTLISTPNKIGAVIAASERSKIMADYVHGGCRQANVKNSCGIYVAGGSYFDLFAGNDVSGDVGTEADGATYCVVTGDAVVHANVYGGNDGYYHCDNGKGRYADNKMGMDQFNPEYDYDPYGEMVGLLLPTQKHSNVFINGGLIKGNVVAGGCMANIGYAYDTVPNISFHGVERKMRGGETKLSKNGTVRLEIAGDAEIRGNVFGGGANASVFGLSQIYIHEHPTILGSLFAGNDCVGQVQSFLPYQGNMEDPKQDLSYFKYYYSDIYAGGDEIATTHNDSVQYLAAHMTHTDSLTVESLNQASQRSSNGDSLNFYTTTVNGIKQYNPKYETYVLIEDSPVINSVYGSGNGAWDYDGKHPEFPSTYVCSGQEGNRPNQKSAFIDIHTSGGLIDTVFGGGAGSTVTEKVLVLLNNTADENSNYPSPLPAGFKGGNNKNFVGTIFGGNNFSDMVPVPNIQLVRGNVKNIYGGGNRGGMKGSDLVYNICGNKVTDVSTHILASSDNVTVTDSVFGGCRMSDITGMAYVEVRNTSNNGIKFLFGGNDVSGNVLGNTRIDMSGGHVHRIFGGSNGRYDFVPIGYEEYNVYPFERYNSEHPERGLIATAGRPHVDSTNVNLWGGTIGASVFAGGSMADCRATCLVVDDQKDTKDEGCPAFATNVTVNGALFGGGEGRWDDLNAHDFEGNRWGNVNGSTHVHLHHAENVTSAKAYGGGGGGDVKNTFIKTYDTWDNTFAAVYGGCWGSEVYGTTHLEFNGKDLVKHLFGGNDFTGNVYRSEIVVNSGNFYNVYGGGNGDYPTAWYTSQYDYDLLRTEDYAYMNAKDNVYSGNKAISRPNTEYVSIVFNDGTVDSCLYGGGRMGTVLPYKKNEDGSYRYELRDTNTVATPSTDDDLPRFIPDTMRVANAGQRDFTHTELTFTDPEDFSYIVVNIHGGKFKRNVFGGGRGYKGDKKPLVYGLKVVNMDGGDIYESLYGGSEFVNDGYPAECRVPVDGEGVALASPTRTQRLSATTRRPSSIVNITGGTVGANFYGTGYQGLVYGSSYVNVGMDAIDSCTVWRNSYGNDTEDSTYIKFKPGYTDGHSDALTTNKLVFKNSLYSGANWGLASGATTFDNPGFVGGESRLYIDGKGYNTTNDHVTSNPEMTIVRSIYGSGTSVLGGDIHSHVEIRNYGGMESCHPTKTVETIQRTDSLWLHNSAIRITGTTDASQQYLTNRYSVTNIGNMNYRGYNVTEFQAAVSKVGTLGFYEQGSTASVHAGEKFDTVLVPLNDINVDANNLTESCGEDKDICRKEYMVSPSEAEKRHTLLILDKGIDFTVGTTMSNGDGTVKGYGFMVTPGGYQSTVTARPKMEITNGTAAQDLAFHSADGGFVSSCPDSNQTRALSANISDHNPDWTNAAGVQEHDEIRYTNHATTEESGFTGNSYRVWKVGDKDGLRETEATILAHTKPQRLAQDWSINLTTGDGRSVPANAQKQKTGIAEAVFTLPATSQGHYYKLSSNGFELSGNNGNIVLVDSAWCPTNLTANTIDGTNVDMAGAMSAIGNWYPTESANDPDGMGSWKTASGVNSTEMEGPKYIRKNPQHTFGLVMVPNNNFGVEEVAGVKHFKMPSASVEPNISEDEVNLVISGNARVNNDNDYCSPLTYTNGTSPEIKPSMRLYLTYDTTFAEAFIGTVTFTLMEYAADGTTVAPIKVTVYIQTIIEELKDVEENVLAMYNGARTNTFTRKIELPPVGEERNLYITGIKWLPTNQNGEDSISNGIFGNTDRFSLLGDSSKVWATSPDYPHTVAADHLSNSNHNSHNRFALTIIPSNNVSGDMNTANGWIRGNGKRTNLYKLAYPTGDGSVPKKVCTWNGTESRVDTVTLRSDANENKGYFLGTLDGRGTAVIDVELTFDGERVYDKVPGKGYVGKAVLTLESIADEDGSPRGTFYITIYVKTREHGDTIYLASANSVTRQVAGNKSVTVNAYDPNTNNPASPSDIGKYPRYYVQSFRKALEEGIYQEGDVLAILDKVEITSPVHITGPNGPAIEVIRYDGHHHDLPDEQSVYRGPMIVVENGNVFTAQNIEFHGGAGAKIKKVVRATPGDDNSDAVLNGSDLQFVTSYTINDVLYNGMDKAPDTNMVWGPIFQVSGAGSTVELREGTIVNHNWNGYGFVNRTDGDAGDQVVDATGMPISTKNMGAISLTDGGTLAITGNVTVENNFGHTMTGYDRNLPVGDTISVEKAPGNGAIYVDGGTLELLESNRNTAITINNNYLMNPSVHESSTSWWLAHIINDKPDHYDLNPSAFSTWHKANVLLTREQAASASTQYEQIMNDDQSDVIVLSGTVGDGTKIGVRKWFPGVHERDTIQIAVAGSGNNAMLESAVENGNFVSDDDFRVFYNSLVNLSKGYLFRCATFRHQLASEPYIASVYDPYNVTIVPRNVLYFGDKGNVCPSGSDSIIYRIQGGLMPYTYTWSDPSKTFILSETTTPYSNAQVENDLGNTSLSVAERTAKYAASMADTLILPKEAIDPTKDRMWNHLLVTATDATGECILYKNIDLRIRMSHDSAALYPVTYMDYAEATYTTDTARNYVLTNYITGENWKTAISNGWTDTSRTVKAIASRNFKGIQITPRVWVDRLDGNITATVPGSANDYIYQYIDESTNHELTGLNFCPGDSIYLYTEPRDKSTKFIMWDFDPYYRQLALYIVPPHDATVTAYYGPDEYWHQHVNTATIADAIYDNNYYYPGNSGHGYVTTYHGDVHIYNENGLAWFISVVNGLNDVQARQFYFNKVYLHKKPKVQKRDELGALVYENDGVTPVMVDDPYDMKNYLWTPVGTQHQPFRGWFIGTSSVATDTTALTGNSKVSIKNIIVNEPHMDYTGFFGSIDTARISGISLESMLVRGAQYVGGLAASSKDAIIKNVAVSDDIEDNSAEHTSATTILSTHYTSGGLIGISNHDKLTDFSSEAKYVGDAVYSGGAVGYGTSTAITNSQARNDNRMSGLYIGGIAGYLDGTAPTKGGLFRRKSAGNPSIVMNNYVRLENSKGSRVGGIVGYAKNTQMENNYFYGDITGASSSNGVAAVMEGSSADGNYYQQDAAKQSVGSRRNGSTEANSTTFEGEGNNVTLAQSVNGRNNLTRVLNAWVREHNYNGGDFYTWRSDLDDANSGYPLFGVPNIIPVHDSMTVYGCDSVEWEGTNYNEGDSLTIHTVDNVEMIDSTLVIRFALHHSSSSNYSDSATIGQTYEGYGFTLTEAETALLLETMDSLGNATLVLRDTFQTVYGCDSVVTLTLYFSGTLDVPEPTFEVKHFVKVFPNPTASYVTIESDGMQHVEFYDNDGRRLQDYDTHSKDTITIDISDYSTGAYYLRIHSAAGVTIQKIVKL